MRFSSFLGAVAGAGLLIGSAFSSMATATVCYVNASSYSCNEGGTISGTIFRQSEPTGANDWNYGASYIGTIYVNPNGQAHPVSGVDVNNRYTYSFTIPANSYSVGFSIAFANNSVMEYDRTATLQVQGNQSTMGARQSASLTIYDDDATNSVYLYYNGSYYLGNQSLPQGLSGASIRIYHNINVYDRAANFTVSGTATRGTDYSSTLPMNGPVTIPNGSYYVDYPLTIANMGQTVNKTLTVTMQAGVYKLDPSATTLNLTFLPPDPPLSVGVGVYEEGTLYSGTTIYEAGTGGANAATVRFFRNYTAGNTVVNYSRSGTAYTDGDYSASPALSGVATIPDGSDHLDVVLTANKSSQTTTNALSVALTGGNYSINPLATGASVTIIPDWPVISMEADTSGILEGGGTANFIVERNPAWMLSGAKSVHVTVGGSAVNGSDYTPTLSTTVTIPAGKGYVLVPINPKADNNQESTETASLTLGNGNYSIDGNYPSATISLYDDTPTVSLCITNVTDSKGHLNPSFLIWRDFYYTAGGLPKTVNYLVSGTASNGVDYVRLSGSASIPAGAQSVVVPITPQPALQTAKTATLTLTNGNYYVLGANTNSTVFIAPDYSIVNVQVADSYAAEAGTNAGLFSITRQGNTNQAVVVQLNVSGTASPGVDYTALPTNVTFAAGVTKLYLSVIPLQNPVTEPAETVVLSIKTNSAYMLGLYTNAVVTITGDGSNPRDLNPMGTRYMRGSGTNLSDYSIIVPLDGLTGTRRSDMDYWQDYYWTSYHYNATNTATQTNIANRIAYNTPIATFGSSWGTPLYFGQSYSLTIYPGVQTGDPLIIYVFNRTNGSYVDVINLPLPDDTYGPDWDNFATNGFARTAEGYGLKTMLRAASDVSISTNAGWVLTHTAEGAATNYSFLVCAGGTDHGQYMTLNDLGQSAFGLFYDLNFEQRPAWSSVFIDQPHFQGQPLPPDLWNKTPTELLNYGAAVTNVISLAPSACTNIDQSPELRRHPILDQFVSDMNRDPMALANYVQNEIDLTDPIAYRDDGSVSTVSVNEGGVDRGALGVYLEGQGSPVEQCALLVYLLRQAGYPATYVFPPEGGLKMLDTRLSALLRMRINGARDDQQRLYTTNQLITVNYPWVAVNVSNQWIHLFPWIKDTAVEEGLDIYDYLPDPYKDTQLWVKDYIYGKTNIMAFATPDDDTPGTIFPRFLSDALQQNAPGVSVDDIGMSYVNRRHLYAQWSDFPRPTWTTNACTAVESLSSSGITNVSPSLTNIFDTVQVELFSGLNPQKDILTPPMRMVDLHNRKFFLTHTNLGNGIIQAILTLGPYRPSATNAIGSFSASDATLTNKQVLTLNLDVTDDSLDLRLRHRRQRALSWETALDPDRGFLDLTGCREVLVDRPLRKGDVAAICFDTGRVTPAMLRVHAQELWNMEQLLSTNSLATNQVSADVYQGTLVYLMGMNYYERASRFDSMNRKLFKVQDLSTFAMGLAKISPRRNADGTLYNGVVDPIWPNVDMFFQEVVTVGNGSVRLDSGWDNKLATQNYYNYSIADLSAQEHATLNKFFGNGTAVSTVKILQLAQNKAASGGSNLVELTYNNYQAAGDTVYNGTALKDFDPNMWAQVSDLFDKGGEYAIGWMPPGTQTTPSGSFSGMAALVLGVDRYAALIGNNQHGGYAEQLPYGSVSSANAPFMGLSEDGESDYNIDFSAPLPGLYDAAPEEVATFDAPVQFHFFDNNAYAANPYQTLLGQSEGLLLTGSSCTYANSFNMSVDNSPVATKTDIRDSNGFWATVSDPVNTLTGEFYIDEVDLSLPGPMPLQVRRNYGSQNLANNQLGYGWKLNYMPYLTVAASNIVYEAESDGSVLAFGPLATNLWAPTLALNPTLNNDSANGIGSMANRLNARLSKAVVNNTNTWSLANGDGSLRVFAEMSFPLTNSPSLDRLRPYLTQWFDNRSNYYRFEYGTDATQADYGQVRRIVSSSGNIVRFEYDIYGHVVDAYCADGRRVDYTYDEHGDLVTVTLPDTSEVDYEYQQLNWATNGTTNVYSTHLVLREDKPDGRTVQNAYDDQRRVTNQWSTVGADLQLVRSATFVYSNDFNLTNLTATISGSTTILDYTNNPTVYYYTNGLIRRIHDALGSEIVQDWYEATETNAPAYPRSLKRVSDKRGLVTQFYYDSKGNVTNSTIQGDLRGDGNFNATAATLTTYSNNLPTRITDPSGATTLLFYTNTWLLARQEYWASNSIDPVVNLFSYVTATNPADGTVSYGLRSQETRAAGSPDAATTALAFSSRGFPTRITRYTGTTDPAVVVTNLYNTRGELAWQTDVDGRSAAFGYDPRGRIQSREIYEARQSIPVSWNYSYYNANGELTWNDGPRYDPEDYVWRDYDGAGRKTQEIHWRSQAQADGSGVEAAPGDGLYSTSFFQYDPANNLTKAIDSLGNYSIKKYDALNRLKREEFYGANGALLATNGFACNAAGDVTNAFNALGGLSEKQYTSTGKPKYQKNADGSTTSWRYYADGRLWREIQGNGAYAETAYNDSLRTATRIFYSAGGTALSTNLTARDRRGNVVDQIDAAGDEFTTSYDALDRVKVSEGPEIISVTVSNSGISIPDPANPSYITNITYEFTEYSYDASGKVLTVNNALDEKTVTTRDALNRPVKVQTFAADGSSIRLITYAYSADHHSVTVTQGSGASALSSTTFTDNDGHAILTSSSPASGQKEYVLNYYDKAGNRIETDQMSQNNGSTYGWSYGQWTYDGLHHPLTEVTKDNATTHFGYDSMGDLTSRQMPGNLTWNATYSPSGQILTEWDSNSGQTTRSSTYTYYQAGNVWAGLLATATDGRGVVTTKTYDDYLRAATISTSGTQLEQQMSAGWQYDPRGLVTNITQGFASTNTGPATAIQRTYNAYGEQVSETVSLNGGAISSATQGWDAAGRRAHLSIGGWANGFQYRADGLMTGSGVSAFSYADNGLLTGRANSFRSMSIDQRDGEGRPLQATTRAGTQALGESWGWNNDGSPWRYTSPRSDFTDSRSFDYSSWSQWLTQETYSLGTGKAATNTYQFDNGTTGGLGVLTKAGGSSLTPTWTGGIDAFSRIASGTNTAIHRTASGKVNGSATLRGYLNGQSVDVRYDPNSASPWKADLSLLPGNNTLTVYADHPSGLFTTNTSSTFTVNAGSSDRETSQYDGAGNVTNRVWKNAAGQVVKSQTLTWNAFGQLVKFTDRDTNNNGANFTATFDALGRQLQTIETAVSNNIALATNPAPLVITYAYDPAVRFQLIGIGLSQGASTRQDWLSYGPDLSGSYGGMQGVGGLESITTSDNKNLTMGVLSDSFGNVLGGITNGVIDWNASRVSMYGPVEGFAPPRLSLNVATYRSLAWRTRPIFAPGEVQLGLRTYDYTRRAFLSADSLGHNSDPALNTAFGGRPSVYFDPSGMCIEGIRSGGQKYAWGLEEGIDTLVDASLGAILKPANGNAPRLDPIQNTWEFVTGNSAYAPSDFGSTMKQTAADLAPAVQNIMYSVGGKAGGNEMETYRAPETQYGDPVSPYVDFPSKSTSLTGSEFSPDQTTVLGENMVGRVIPYANETGNRVLPWAATPEEWAEMTPYERWKANDGSLRTRIGEGDNFVYIGQDPDRSPTARAQFDLTASELLRLQDRNVTVNRVDVVNVYEVVGNPGEVTRSTGH